MMKTFAILAAVTLLAACTHPRPVPPADMTNTVEPRPNPDGSQK